MLPSAKKKRFSLDLCSEEDLLIEEAGAPGRAFPNISSEDEAILRPTALFEMQRPILHTSSNSGESSTSLLAVQQHSGLPRATGKCVPDHRVPTLTEAQPRGRPYAQPVTRQHSILVNTRQQGNPVLKHVRNVLWEYADVVPDYQLGAYTAALYISLRYHLLHPDYVDARIRELQKEYRLRVILCLVDVEDASKLLLSLTKLAYDNKCTLILTWSVEEAARYIETYKAYENKPPDIIQGMLESDYYTVLCDVLTSIRSVNKTDVYTLATTFGTLQAIINASQEELNICPGLGDKKVQRIFEAFRTSLKIRK